VTGYLKLAGAGRCGESVAPDRSRAWSARPQHHGILQGVQRARPQKEEKNTPIPVVITIYADRSFTFEMKTPPMSFLLKQAAKIQSGSKAPGRDKAGAVTKRAGARDRRRRR
jgi:large subunit ribosomal protein L11